MAQAQLTHPHRSSFTKTATGLEYRVLRAGSGEKPTAADTVSVHYHGWLDNGTVFDSSYKRGQSIEFPLSGVIPGWTEGMQLVAQGGMIELQIPSAIGYGARGAPPVDSTKCHVALRRGTARYKIISGSLVRVCHDPHERLPASKSRFFCERSDTLFKGCLFLPTR